MSTQFKRFFNPEPSRVVNASSIETDEQARFAHPITIPHVGRDALVPPPNGNLRAIIPDIDKEEVQATLCRSQRVNTNTRTIFNTDQALDTHDTIADKVLSPSFKCSAPKQGGHFSMDRMAPHDPRQQHMPMQTPVDLGPGCYAVDPTHCMATAAPTSWGPNQSHAMLPLARDPSCPSSAFKSPPRGRTQDDLAAERRAEGVPSYMLPPDWASWTKRGIHMGKGKRIIRSELWGRSAREPRAPPGEYAERMRETEHGTCVKFALDVHSPTYKVAFASQLPRVMAKSADNKRDTRMRVKSADKVYGTSRNLGPGSYNPEIPGRFRSWHAGLQGTADYLPQGASISPDREMLVDSPVRSRVKSLFQRQPTQVPGMDAAASSAPLSPCRASSVSSPIVSPKTGVVLPPPWMADLPATVPPSATVEALLSPLSSPMRSPTVKPPLLDLIVEQSQFGQDEVPAEVQDAMAADWLMHQALLATAYMRTDDLRGAVTREKLMLSPRKPPPSSHAPQTANLQLEDADEQLETLLAANALLQAQMIGAPGSLLPYPDPVMLSEALDQLQYRDTSLMFLRRAVPHKTIIHTQLKAVADLKAERTKFKLAALYP